MQTILYPACSATVAKWGRQAGRLCVSRVLQTRKKSLAIKGDQGLGSIPSVPVLAERHHRPTDRDSAVSCVPMVQLSGMQVHLKKKINLIAKSK